MRQFFWPERIPDGLTNRRRKKRPEAELLLSCVAAGLGDRLLDTQSIGKELDWELVISAASRHGVMPLVCRALSTASLSYAPASVHHQIHRESSGHALLSHHLSNELVRLCRALEQNGVRALAIKGPALAASLYGRITLRQFTDLDLLVREGDLAAALAVFKSDDYRPATPVAFDAARAIRVPGAHEVTLVKDGSLFTIDLHWRLSPPFFPLTPEGEELWQRRIEVRLGPGCVSTLGAEDLMLYLCAHGAKHGWQSLSGVCDLAMAASRYQYNWEMLVARAETYGGLRSLLLGALLAYDLLGAAIPERVIVMARAHSSVDRSARTFRRYFYRLDLDGPRLPQRWLIPIGMISDRALRVRYALARALFPAEADWQFVRLPGILFPLYFVLRPLRLFWQKGLPRGVK